MTRSYTLFGKIQAFRPMRIISKGQVTIHQDVRERFGFHLHTEIEFNVTPDARCHPLPHLFSASGRSDTGLPTLAGDAQRLQHEGQDHGQGRGAGERDQGALPG